jgi:tRNA threonylcarbamoyladenosine biosynthesis protein TsaB
VITLALDAATYTGTVAVFHDGGLVAEGDAAMRGDREALLPAVHRALRDAGVGVADVGRVVCGAGPGSFTSLRIAASIAKGLAYARRAQLDVVPSLGLIIASQDSLPRGSYLACLDALRGEMYVAGFELDDRGGLVECLPLRLALSDHVAALAASIGATPIGPSQRLHAMPRARGALRVSTLGVSDVDIGSWEPEYGRKAEAQAKWEAAHGRALPGG